MLIQALEEVAGGTAALVLFGLALVIGERWMRRW